MRSGRLTAWRSRRDLAVRAASLGARLGRARATLTHALHRVLGAPDYAAYVAHMRARHPGAPIADRADFVREGLERRHAAPGTRCC